ncbi:hypothetical protein GCM10011581_17850 [Saccharopolyspora subtropica]|uniref:Zinc-finger n=1 Tax=Saccharopolyspora thermophila TaxID=89367 RepID=A0A917JTG9_9PSEU|nr:hypothetical protein [Saccharopolyspora subtropica]GGI80910.1 hypothetical protein GCM10011581_17850 [Saccharopolyspora subtropica]
MSMVDSRPHSPHVDRVFWMPVPDQQVPASDGTVEGAGVRAGTRHAFWGRRWDGQEAEVRTVCGVVVNLDESSPLDWITMPECGPCRTEILRVRGEMRS